MTIELKNLHWFYSDHKYIGFSETGMLLKDEFSNNAIYIDEGNVWFGYFEYDIFTSVMTGEWRDDYEQN